MRLREYETMRLREYESTSVRGTRTVFGILLEPLRQLLGPLGGLLEGSSELFGSSWGRPRRKRPFTS